MLSPCDVVTLDGASALLGDVVSVDEIHGVATVAWRAITTTELLDDLRIEVGAPSSPSP